MSIDTMKLPAVFGRYILLRRMSRGGMGEIFLGKLGEIQGFEKPIVIKKILPDLAQDREFLQRFIEEAQIAIKLTHGNIVPVYEVGMVDGDYFLALQYIEGRDLRSLINRAHERKRRIPPDLCLYLVREIANGLAYAHRKTDEVGNPLELVHCDISPPNVLVSWEGEVKIIDFGIAKSAIQRAQADESIGFGKFGYMAAEQLLRGGVVDRRTDIYSTGVLLFELLTGERLFRFPPGTDYRRVAREVTAGKIDAPSERDVHLTDSFDVLVTRALRTEKDERYQSAEELRDAVQQKLYGMNPTISADALGAFLQELFVEEIDTDRQMLSSLSQTDVEPFRTELNDGSSHTVSYALAGTWTGGGSVLPAQPPEVQVRAAQITPTGQAGGTRRLDGQEPSTYTVLVQQRRRMLVLAGAVLLVLVGIGVGLGMMLRRDGSPRMADSTPVGLPGVAAGAPDAAQVRVTPLPPGPDAGPARSHETAHDAAVALVFAPDPVRQSDAGMTTTKVRARPIRIRRPRRRRPRPVKPRAASPEMMQRTFRQVSREYSEFKRSYGGVLDDAWQKILFASTYDGNMDEGRYQRLKAMLDDMRRKMKHVRERDR